MDYAVAEAVEMAIRKMCYVTVYFQLIKEGEEKSKTLAIADMLCAPRVGEYIQVCCQPEKAIHEMTKEERARLVNGLHHLGCFLVCNVEWRATDNTNVRENSKDRLCWVYVVPVPAKEGNA